MNKYYLSEEKIKKQKKENEKKLSQKFLQIAIKREDTSQILIRNERQKELRRQKKVESLEKRDEKLQEIQRQKNEINNIKRELGQNIQKRKSELLKKVKTILALGNFKSKDDIYQKVFNREELDLLGKKGKKSNNSVNKLNKTQVNSDTFFLTQSDLHNNKNL